MITVYKEFNEAIQSHFFKKTANKVTAGTAKFPS